MNIRNTLGTGYGLLAITALAMSQTTLVQAASPAGPDVKVQYQRSSLDTIDGANALLKRIERASASVCSSFNHADVAARARRDECRRTLTQTAVDEVNHPLLMTVYASRHHTTRRLLAAAQ